MTTIPDALYSIRNGQLRFELPPVIDDPQIKTAASDYQRLVEQSDTASSEAYAAEEARESAVQTDADAYARALRAGKPDPGEQATKAADEKIVQLRRRAAALTIATEAALGDLLEVIEHRRTAWSKTLASKLAKSRPALISALDAVAAAHAEMVDALATDLWLRDVPARAFWRAGSIAQNIPMPAIRDGDVIRVDTVLGLLRDLAEPTQTKPREETPSEAAGSRNDGVIA